MKVAVNAPTAELIRALVQPGDRVSRDEGDVEVRDQLDAAAIGPDLMQQHIQPVLVADAVQRVRIGM